MIRAIVWKELREQGLIALTLLVFGVAILIAAATLTDPPASAASPADVVRYLGAGRLATLLLAVTAGMVCGGALFAAEREAGTIGFLESLPASRWELWAAKLTAGLGLAVAQVAVVLGVSGGLGLVGTTGFGLAVVVYALLAFAWGAFGSTVARTTLGSVGVAIPTASVTSLIYLFPIMLFFSQPGASWPRVEGALIFLALMLLTPLVLSAMLFTRPDRDRMSDDPGGSLWLARVRYPDQPRGVRLAPPPPRSSPHPRLGFRALIWMSTRQLTFPFLVTSAFAVVTGLILLLPTIYPFLAWPIIGLAAGVIAGVTTFGDEQGHGTAQFWGERRLPVGRMWAVKVLIHALFALWLTFLVTLPSIIRAAIDPGVTGARGQTFLSGVFRTLLFDELGRQGWKFLLVPVAYGFAAGHVCGLLFRKTVVGAGVAGLIGGTAGALWLPSLLAGGVSHWQVWLPPVAALGVGRLLVRAWASERLLSRGPLGVLAGGLVVVLLVQAAGLGYRVVEVPENPIGEDDVAFVATLPDFDANKAGRTFRTATERFSRVAGAVTLHFDRQGAAQRQPRVEDRMENAIQFGWPADKDPELDRWLDAVYADAPSTPDDGPWYRLAEEAAARPVGIYEDPRLSGGPGTGAGLENARRMALVVLARGLQLQARDGDHAAFVGSFRVALALARNLRNRSVMPAVQSGNAVERVSLFAAYQWVRNLQAAEPPTGPRPVDPPLRVRTAARLEAAWLLALVLAANAEPDPFAPFDPTPHLLAERYVIRELMKAPGQWLPDAITPPGKNKDAATTEADLVGFAWTVPWERERTRRLIGLGFDSDTRSLIKGRPGAPLLLPRSDAATELAEADRILRVFRRGVALILAVRLYRTLEGRPPKTLAELVAAGLLPVVPPDPYDDQPFRYRVSNGETLISPSRPGPTGDLRGPIPGTGPAGERGRPPEPPTLSIPNGQPVIWSVGADKIDQGGKFLPILPGGFPRQEDWVFLVPL